MHKISREIRANRTKKKKKHWMQVLKNQATAFCLGTGLHGYKYIAQSQRSKTERIVWCAIVIVSLGCAVALMHRAWNYNSARPTLTVIESTHHGIWNYPFPAVTVCNINRVSLRAAQQFVTKLKIPTDLSEEYLVTEMGLLNELLNPGLFGYDVRKNLSKLQDIFDASGYSISQVVKEVTQNCSSLILGCKWKGHWTACHDLFQQSLSRDGVCCSFNYITSDDPRTPPKKTPEKVTACGYQTGLTILVNTESDDYLAAILGSYGVKIMLHYPYDYPDYNAENKLVGKSYQVFLSVSPEETYSTPEVRELAEKTRDCVFDDERVIYKDDDINKLNFTYAKYTYKNCMVECRASTIKAKCSCIPYYYPQNGTRVCNLKDVPCLQNYSSWFETSWPGISMEGGTVLSTMADHNKRPCGCMPDCSLFRYPVEGSLGVIDRRNSYSDLIFLKNLTVQGETMVHIFFSDLVSIQYRRNAYYNWRNLFASFGGLLGLFAGFSLMSGYELVYFFVIRVIADACMKKKIDSSSDNANNDRLEGRNIKRRGF